MTYLPLTIEQQLKEAGFCGTEILVLRHLLAGLSYTVRELASKTGKSTGVVDQSIKKLLRKNIVQVQRMNDAPKYYLSSAQSLARYLKRSITEQITVVERRARDIEQYLDSLKIQTDQPSMEFFTGEKGMLALAKRLVELTPAKQTIVAYLPTTPEIQTQYKFVRDAFTQLRTTHGNMLHMLTHATNVGKQTRELDVLHLRETRFIPEHICPLQVGHILAGNGYASINYQKMEAFLLICPDFTLEKSSIFEALWHQAEPVNPLKNQTGTTEHNTQSLPMAAIF